MQGAKRKREYSDVPSVTINQSRLLGGWGRDKWRLLWDEVYSHIVDHWDGDNGTLIDLDSLIRAVFPHIAKNHVARETVKQLFLTRLYAYKADRHTRPEEKAEKADE